jgi:hypothetical protein
MTTPARSKLDESIGSKPQKIAWNGATSRGWPQGRAEVGADIRPAGWAVSIEPHVGLALTRREFYGPWRAIRRRTRRTASSS